MPDTFWRERLNWNSGPSELNNRFIYSSSTSCLLEEAGVSGENYRPWTSNWYIWSLAAVSWVHLSWNIQNGARTQGVLVIGLYELLDPQDDIHLPFFLLYLFLIFWQRLQRKKLWSMSHPTSGFVINTPFQTRYIFCIESSDDWIFGTMSEPSDH
jgi:nucleoside-diphosphate-sugar epimerase